MAGKYDLFKLADELSGILRESAVNEELEKNAEQKKIAELTQELDELKEKIDNMSLKKESSVNKVNNKEHEEDTSVDELCDSLGEPEGHDKLSGNDNPLSDYLHKKYA